MRYSEASDYWNKALAALDLSEINAKERAKLKALLWGDIAQLRFEEDKFFEAMEALETQIGYFKQSNIRGNILASTWHNLGMVQLRLNQFITARKSFEEALSFSEKNSVQAIDDLVQIANTWRLAGNIEKAITFFQNAVTYAEALGSNGDYMRAVALGNLALCQYEKGELEAANRTIVQARSLFVSVNALDDLSAAEELMKEIRKRQNK